MALLLLIIILILFIQLALAATSWSIKNSIRKRYSNAISSQVSPQSILESNEKRFGKIKIKLVNHLDDIAFAEKDLLYINARSFNRNTLYLNYKFFYYFYLTSNSSSYLRKLKVIQNVLFSLQIITLLIGVIFIQLDFNIFFAISLMLQVFMLFYTIFNYFLLKDFLHDVYDKSKNILKLDNVEESRLESLINDLNQEVFEYPFEIIWRIYQFVKP